MGALCIYKPHMLLSSGSMVASLPRPLAASGVAGGAGRRRNFAGRAPVFFTSSSFRSALEGVKKTSLSPPHFHSSHRLAERHG